MLSEEQSNKQMNRWQTALQFEITIVCSAVATLNAFRNRVLVVVLFDWMIPLPVNCNNSNYLPFLLVMAIKPHPQRG